MMAKRSGKKFATCSEFLFVCLLDDAFLFSFFLHYHYGCLSSRCPCVMLACITMQKSSHWFHCKTDNLMENTSENYLPRYPYRGSIVWHMKYCTTIQRLVWWMWISYPENLLMITLLPSWCVFGMVISSMLVFWFVCIACNTCHFWFSLKVSWAETHKEAKAGVYSVNFYDDEGFAAFRKVSWLLLLMLLWQWHSNKRVLVLNTHNNIIVSQVVKCSA